MASHFQVQKPHVLTTLPRPLDPITGRYVVGEVYGSKPGTRKRKRHELAVGIDGEAVNIYDVSSSSKLVTSYPIPPQSRISCTTSIRRRSPETKGATRLTYAATEEAPAHKLSLFKDHEEDSGKITSTTASISLAPGLPVVCLAPISPPVSQPDAGVHMSDEDLLVVRGDGEVMCLDAETLETKWKSSSTALYQDLHGATKSNFQIEFCRSVHLSDVVNCIFKDSGEASSLHPTEKQGDGTGSEVLVLVSSFGPVGQQKRHVHIVGLLPSSRNSVRTQQGVFQLRVLPIVSQSQQEESEVCYRLDVRSGSLLELRDQVLNVHDLTAGIPKVTSAMGLEGASSFLHLSRTSLLCSSNTKVNVYNPLFRSLQDSVDIRQAQGDTYDAGRSTPCALVAYFSKLELAVAIVDSNLVAIQLEAPATRTKKRRAEGLLIDSIGRGVQSTKKIATDVSRPPPEQSVFSNYIPGSIRGDYWQEWTADEARADALLNADDIPGFEMLLAEKCGIRVSGANVTNGVDNEEHDASKAPTTWQWPKSRNAYPPADRRWILYAISRAFQWNDTVSDDLTLPRLICQLPQSNVVNYLVDAGHLTLSNVKSAFREKFNKMGQGESFLAEQLVTRLADVDPSLELVVAYLSATNLGAIELLIAVRTIMKSLELVQDPKKPPPKLLTDGSTEEPAKATGEADNEDIGMELDDLEDQIQKTVSYLNEDAGIRGTGLSVAFAKLGNCPSLSMIKALRATFRPEEILSLVYLLRVELVKGAWTSRYLDTTDFEKDVALDAPPDGIIKLIADLLGRCVDSIGPGGWLLNDAILAGDDSGDFVASLKLEVSAALEGLEEAVYLRGIVGEAVKFCETLRKAEKEDAVDKMKPISLHVREPGAEALPLGLKSEQQSISAHKVVSGGEIKERSQRETGHLISQQVGPYSLERIAI